MGLGILLAALLPRLLALSLAAAILLPPLIRVVGRQRQWNALVQSHGARERGRGEEGTARAAAHKAGENEGEGEGDDSSGELLGVRELKLGDLPPIIAGRMAAGMSGGFCLFLIGARSNNPWRLTQGFKGLGDKFVSMIK